MFISNIQNTTRSNNKLSAPVSYRKIAALNCDTVSFGAMKKLQFDGLDYVVVEKFKAPIEKFNTNQDLQNWAKTMINEIKDKDLGGRQEETKIQRKAMLKEWTDYVTKENKAYNSAAALLILSAITKDLEADNDKIPPVLNKGVLADCISEIDKNIKQDKKWKFDLNKIYETKLCSLYLEDNKTGETGTKWLIIPSKTNDLKNFEKNVEKLKILSHKNWCTKSFNAEPYLEEGDFHIYLENGQPKIGIRFTDNEIEEIQGELNNGKIPLKYLDQVQEHIEKNNLELSWDAREKINDANNIKEEMAEIAKELKNAIENNDAKKIFNYFNISVKTDKDGLLTISKYEQPSTDFTYFDLGINENKLFEKVKAVSEFADFSGSLITDLSNLKSIKGDADFSNSRITDLGNLKSIGGDADFSNSRITDLGNLKSIGGDADFSHSKITDLGNLKSIGGYADFEDSKVTDLGRLKSIDGDAYFTNSLITSLANLESIGGDADFEDSKVTDLGRLKSIAGDANFTNSLITSLANLEYIGGSAEFKNSCVRDTGKLKTVSRDVYTKNSLLKPEDFENVEVYGLIW